MTTKQEISNIENRYWAIFNKKFLSNKDKEIARQLMDRWKYLTNYKNK